MGEAIPYKDRIMIGVAQTITIESPMGDQRCPARIDTGATKSSIDYKLATKLKLGPIIESRLIKSAHGNRLRPVIEVTIVIQGKKITSSFTLADRDHLKYKVLIGQNILKKGFLIDPNL